MENLTDEEVAESIEGAQAVVEYFGAWESCHDAEILDIHISHMARCTISLHAMAGATPDFSRWNHAILTFTLRGVRDLSLTGFSPQNLLGSVWFLRAGSGLRMVLQGVDGTDGWVEADTIAVDIYPLTIS